MKGYAILVGVDEVNPKHYGVSMITPSAKNSAEKIHRHLLDFSTIPDNRIDVYVGKEAVFHDIDIRMKHYARLSNLPNSEPIFLFLYFAGHSFSMDGKEKGEFTFFNLYDQMLFENEFKNWLKDFHIDSKLFCVIDSCYAGGYGSDKKLIMDNDFGLIDNGENAYEQLIKYYNNKLKIELNSNEYPETFMIAAVGKLNWARIDMVQNIFDFTFWLLKFLEENKEEKKNYEPFFYKLQNHFVETADSSRGVGHIPQKFHYKCSLSYFVNNKPLKI
ncbi:MAG: hypothetical protein HND54_12465 [Bacteroidetes bacterium]|nr:hypothetical protein [Bacteroidota bacterium]